MCGMPAKIGQTWIHPHSFGKAECPLSDMSVIQLLWLCRHKLCDDLGWNDGIRELGNDGVKKLDFEETRDWIEWLCRKDDIQGLSNAVLGLVALIESCSRGAL